MPSLPLAVGRRRQSGKRERDDKGAPVFKESQAVINAERRTAWIRAGLCFAGASLLHFALHFDAVRSTVTVWAESDTYGYGFLIIPLVLYLGYQRRAQIKPLIPEPCYWAIAWIAGSILIDVIGSIASVMLLKQLAFVALWQGLFALFMGWQVVQRLLFPLLFLFFAVPVGQEIVPLLQTITAEISVFLLRASGIPTFLDGVLIEIPTGRFVVAEVCSGARFLITSVVIGALLSNLFFRSWRRRVVMMLLSLSVPIVANGLRAYGIIVLAYVSDNRLAVSVDHIIYGFIFLSIVLALLIGLGTLFRERWYQEEAQKPVSASVGARPFASFVAFIFALLVLGSGKVWSMQVLKPPEPTASIGVSTSHSMEDWHLSSQSTTEWSPRFQGADLEKQWTYQSAQGEVTVYFVHYTYQSEGRELIANDNSFAGEGDRVTRFGQIDVATAFGQQRFQETLTLSKGRRRLIWSWYEIGGTPTISALHGKALQIWHTLRGGSRAASGIAVSMSADGDLQKTRSHLRAFLEAFRSKEGGPMVTVSKEKRSGEAFNRQNAENL